MARKAEPNDPEKYPRITIRVSSELRDAIERRADEDRRSVSSWISLALEAAVVTPAPRPGVLAAAINKAKLDDARAKKKRRR